MVIELLSIGLASFMVCFYTYYVMKDWGVIKEKKVPKNKK